MPHSPNLRWTGAGTKAHHLDKAQARSFDKAHDKKQQMAGKMKGYPTDAQMQKEIKANAKRIASNPNHPVMQMERDHAAGMRHD